MSKVNSNIEENQLDIAIVGMACRFPGANNLDEFWANLSEGKESITFFSDEELLAAGIDQSYLDDPNYIKAAPILKGADMFDARFFGFTPGEAKILDPQHRLLLECAHEALEHAGYGHDPEKLHGPVGVFTGSAMNTYLLNSDLRNKFITNYIPTLIGNDKDFLSTRISYKLNLTGPSMNVQTACSTSLVAVHLACQSLLNEECDMALVGAISVKAPHKAGYLYQEGGVLSPDAQVRAFDAQANGTVFGSGGGIVVLKRLSDAVEEGDTIQAVIKGSAINNDGANKAGYSAPSVNSQANVILDAHSYAEIDAESLSYIETHGSGTPVGDPIEIKALTKAFRESTESSGFCAIGSVKTNIGHLDAAAGIASLIKTVLSLQNQQIPASLHFTEPNPDIDFENSPFYVNSQIRNWEKTSDKRRAGVLSTGMGGTNAYVILEEAPMAENNETSKGEKLLVLSAKTKSALENATNNLTHFLKENIDINLDDLTYTLQAGRKPYKNRRFLICKDRQEAIDLLETNSSQSFFPSQLSDSFDKPMVFLFPGIGDHYVGMANDLYQGNDFFREQVDSCAEIIKQCNNVDIREIIYPQDYHKNKKGDAKQGIDLAMMLGKGPRKNNEASQTLNKTIYSQPALFTIEYSLAKLWMEWGITPKAMVGHSMGEYVAACLAGVFSLEHALRLIVKRAKLVNDLPLGSMLAVTLAEDELKSLLNSNLSISLINGPKLCVVAGLAHHVNKFEQLLKEKEILYRPVQNAHAFHSSMLDPIVEKYTEEIKKVKLNPPKIPFISNLTGTWITPENAIDPSYWARHANHAVRFDDAFAELWQLSNSIFLEIGPGKTLGVLAMQHPERQKSENPIVVSSMRHDYDNQSDMGYILQTVGELWKAGVDLDWDKITGNVKRKRIPLPTYPFEQERHWIALKNESTKKTTGKSDLSKWFYVPSWRLSPFSKGNRQEQAKKNYLIFDNDSELGRQLTERLVERGSDIIKITEGSGFKKINEKSYSINPQQEDDYYELLKDIEVNLGQSYEVIHMWSITSVNAVSGPELFEKLQNLGFYSLVNIGKALRKNNNQNNIKITVLSNNMHSVNGEDKVIPEKATILSPTVVMPQENSNIFCCSIDIILDQITSRKQSSLLNQIIFDIEENFSDGLVSYRGNQRYIQIFDRIELREPPDDSSELNHNTGIISLKKKGVYLITGGLGQIGLIFAKYLAQKVKAKLVLIGRSMFPPRSEWNSWIKDHDDEDIICQTIAKIRLLEELGSEVIIENADVSDHQQMADLVDRVYKNMGNVNGVFHGAGFIKEGAFRFLEELDREHCMEHFKSKVYGTYVLAKLFKNKDLDFILTTSTIASILGGLGHLAYSAANAFMDSYAYYSYQTDDIPWVSIDWDIWRLGSTEEQMSKLGGVTLAELGITPDEGMRVLDRVFSPHYSNRLVISTGELALRISQWVKLDSRKQEEDKLKVTYHPENSEYIEEQSSIGIDNQAGITEGEISETPVCETDDPPTTETEDKVWKIWAAILGINKIGIHDNFFELGGHSLLAVEVIARLRDTFQAGFSIGEFFDGPTISEISSKIAIKTSELMQMLDMKEIQDLFKDKT